MFQTAYTWGAIILLDDGESLVAKRSLDDYLRSARVAVFLRHLEYHQGMMFLTTNLHVNIDPAVSDRCQLQIEYGYFDIDTAVRVFVQHLCRIGQGGDSPLLSDEQKKELLCGYGTGRQVSILNSFSSDNR